MGALLVHCGLHKTGSSAFQHWLVRHQADLSAAGVAFPAALVSRTGNAAKLALRVLTKSPETLTQPETAARARFTRFCADHATGDVLISAEDFETEFTCRIEESEIPAMLGSASQADAALKDRGKAIRGHVRQLRECAQRAGLDGVVLAFVLRNMADKRASGVAQRVKQLSMPAERITLRRADDGFAPWATFFSMLEDEGAQCRVGVVGGHPGGVIAQVLDLLGLGARLPAGTDLTMGEVNPSIGEVGVVCAIALRRQLESAGLAGHERLRRSLKSLLTEACKDLRDRPFHGFTAADASRFAEGQARLDGALGPWLSADEIAQLAVRRFTGPPSPLTVEELTGEQRAMAEGIFAHLAKGVQRLGLDLPFEPALPTDGVRAYLSPGAGAAQRAKSVSRKQAIVHIGNVKTGTTAIQAVLRVLRPELAQAGVIVPGLRPKEPAHYALQLELGLAADRAVRTAAILQDIASASDDKTILLTAETLMHVPAAWLREKLAANGCDSVQIILYVRPHVSLFGSFYLQNLKMAIARGPVSEHLGKLRGQNIQFMRVAEDYGRVFGHSNVVVREFHRSVLHDGSIVGDFWDMAGLPADLRARAVATSQISNPTPSAEVALLLRACSNFVHANATAKERQENDAAPPGRNGSFRRTNYALFRRLVALEDDLPGTRYRLPVYLQEALNTRFRAERERFAATWFRSPPSPFWVDEPVEPAEPLRDLPAAAVNRALNAAIKALQNEDTRQGVLALQAFREKLPLVGKEPNLMVSVAALAKTFDLSDDVPPSDAQLHRLLTPK